MTQTLLVLGGSGFVGHAVAAEGLARGWRVTTFNRGRNPGGEPPGAECLVGDRTDPASLAALGERRFDVVVDTWSGAPAAVRDAARALDRRAGRYVYVSSGSVYDPPNPVGADESWPTADADPDDARDDDYARAKRGAELAVLRAVGERALLLRAGLILGPREDIGRLPWWLERLHRGGEVLAPGPPQRPLAFVDARDLARFALDAALAGLSGPCNVVGRRGDATMERLLEACRRVAGAPGASLTWADPALIERCGIEGWTELPIWLAPGGPHEGMHGMDSERAHAAGLRCRPVQETVADTWAWMGSLPGPPPLRAGVPTPGISAERERAALAQVHAGGRDHH